MSSHRAFFARTPYSDIRQANNFISKYIVAMCNGFAAEYALRLLASMPFFKQPPCCLTYLFSTAKRSKQERPRANQFFYPSANLASKSERLKVASMQSPRLVQTSRSGHLTSQNFGWKNWSRDKNGFAAKACATLTVINDNFETESLKQNWVFPVSKI